MQISDAKKVLENVLEKLNIDVKRVEVVAGDPHPLLSITTSDSGILIGVQGENLRALNHLIRKIVESKMDGKPAHSFLVDVNGYYRKHLNLLKQQARILAERARVFKSDIAMDPVNSYERMVVHATFASDPDIYTESTGVGKQRRVVFKYRKRQESSGTTDKALFSKESS